MNTTLPEKVDFSSKRLELISSRMQKYIDAKELAGIVTMVARKGEIVQSDAYGWSDVESRKKMEQDSIFRIMSMTKPITAAAIMTLYEEGHFTLNTPVSEFLPEFENLKVKVVKADGTTELENLIRPVTFRHLFTHTAGFGYDNPISDEILMARTKWRDGTEKCNQKYSLQYFVKKLLESPLSFQPGTNFCYSFATDILGYLIEVISGISLDKFIGERITGPLKMVDTSFSLPVNKLDRFTSHYGHVENQSGLRLVEKSEESIYLNKPIFLSGGGGLLSTVNDYGKFLQMFINDGIFEGHRILSPSTVNLFTINQAPIEVLPFNIAGKEDLFHRGYGVSLATRVLMDIGMSGQAGNVGEFGWDGMYSTHCWVDKTKDIFGIFLTQHEPFNYYPVANIFKQLTYQALMV